MVWKDEYHEQGKVWVDEQITMILTNCSNNKIISVPDGVHEAEYWIFNKCWMTGTVYPIWGRRHIMRG